jgi:hypothetical protein
VRSTPQCVLSHSERFSALIGRLVALPPRIARPRRWKIESARVTLASLRPGPRRESKKELAEQCPEALDGWREQADRARARALAAYEQVRSRSESVVPEEEG